MSRDLKYRAFFVTVASKSGVPQSIATGIVDALSKRCEEIDYVSESHESGRIHVHIMLLLQKSTTRCNFKQTVKSICLKYISAPDVKNGLDVRVITDQKVVQEYMEKSSDSLQCNFSKLCTYVHENYGIADDIIKANADYKSNQIKYAYDNWNTWKVVLDWNKPLPEVWSQYKILMAEHDGKSPSTYWKLAHVFERHCYRAGAIDKSNMANDFPNFLPESNLNRNHNKYIFAKI